MSNQEQSIVEDFAARLSVGLPEIFDNSDADPKQKRAAAHFFAIRYGVTNV